MRMALMGPLCSWSERQRITAIVCWLSARSPEMNQLLEVSAGMLNQNAGMKSSPASTIRRIEAVGKALDCG